MLRVDQYAEIRRAHRDGMSIREIARRFRRSKRTVRKVLSNAEPTPYARRKPTACPKLDPFKRRIDAILAADEQAPRKQRHTAAQVYRRLVEEEGYRGSYDQVRRYIRGKRRRERETFIPLTHEPGVRAEADFGHIAVDFPDGRRQVPVLLVVWSYSQYPFALALPSERTEAILYGLTHGFAFFGAVPRELWWDNPKTVAAAIFRGRDRLLHPRYEALGSHYTFEPKFCLPRRGNEKPAVEHRVYDLQRRWATPVPRVADEAALNAYLRECCLRERERTSGQQTETIGVRFEREKLHALELPAHAFDPCVPQPAKVDKFQLAHFDTNHYSVPRRWAFETVTIKAYPYEVRIVAAGQEIARHRRSYGRGEQILDPLHYLITLERRPAALDHSAVYRDWKLPEIFGQLRQLLEGKHGPLTGVRHFVRVLQLLANHPLERVEKAVWHCLSGGVVNAEAIGARVELSAARASNRSPDCAQDHADNDVADRSSSAVSPLLAVQVPKPDLSRFNQLLS